MNQKDSNEVGSDRFRMAGGLLVSACKAFAAPWESVLRGGFGPRYFGKHAAATLLLIPFWTILWPGEDCRLLLGLVFVHVGLCLAVRLGTLRRTLRGERVHSYYNGKPRLAGLLPSMSEQAIKSFVDPLVAFIGGTLVVAVDRPLGSFLMTGAFALFASGAVVEAYQRRRATDLHDAWLDQQHLVEDFRRMRGD